LNVSDSFARQIFSQSEYSGSAILYWLNMNFAIRYETGHCPCVFADLPTPESVAVTRRPELPKHFRTYYFFQSISETFCLLYHGNPDYHADCPIRICGLLRPKH